MYPQMDVYRVIGLMSGTSLDGLDIAYCEFEKRGEKWSYRILQAETRSYSAAWKKKLSGAAKLSQPERVKLDKEYGNFIAENTEQFIRKYSLTPDLIASHGHTVFHQPEKKLTLQIGDGAIIASVCKLPVVFDFRSGDVQLGGQGAPLVPVADKLLFPEYYFCLNLGGFANISFDTSAGDRIAFDICPVNIVLNELAGMLGKEFDAGGKIASGGNINPPLLRELNDLPYYKKTYPKSLGREWVESEIFPLLSKYAFPAADLLRTMTEHIAIQIASQVNSVHAKSQRILVTGGGAYNSFLIERLREHTACLVVLPDDLTIQFKEAMAFAFLGVLRLREEINILKTVTGASRDSSGGQLILPG